ncbi:MAG: hypothetical protein ACTSVV_14870, partial [Promethearchaeota archaeon]
SYYKPYKEILREILGESRAKEVIEKLLLLGLNETENLTDIDIKSILMKSENLLIIEKWLKFNIKKFKVRLEKNWNLFINVKNLLENERSINFEYLFRINAIFFSSNRLFIRKEVEFAFFEVCKKIKAKIRNKIGGIDNVIILPIDNVRMEDLNELKGKIIIKLNTLNWKTNEYYHPIINEDVLENNVILLISPKEVGFRFTKKTLNNEKEDLLEYPDKNFEFNAIGEVDNLKRVKNIFNTCKWDIVKYHAIIEAAKKRIWEKENPPISIEKGINELKKGMNEIDAKILIDTLLIIMNPPVNYSSIFIYKDFNKNDLWIFVENILKLKYELTNEEFLQIKEIIEETFEKKVRIDLLTLGLGSRPGASKYYTLLKKIQEQIFQLTDIQDCLITYIKDLTQREKKILWIYLKFFFNSPLNINFYEFKLFYQSVFNEDIESIDNITDVINKSGIVICKRIGDDFIYETPFSFVIENDINYKFLNILAQFINIKKIQVKEFIIKYKNNIVELAGLDFLLSIEDICSGEKLKEFLETISSEAWNKFEPYNQVITTNRNELFMVNPLIRNDLRESINFIKNGMKKTHKKIKEIILSLEIKDSTIELDKTLFIIRGFITLQSDDKINIIITPWFLPQYKEYFGEKNLIIITNQPDYETFLTYIKELENEIALVFLQDNQFYLFSNFHNTDFIDSLIWQLEENNFELISKEIVVSESFNESNIDDTSIVMEENGENFPENASGMDDFDPFGEIFNVDLKDFPIGLNIEEPLIIIIPKKEKEEYGATIQIICRELYREFVGGLPIPKRMTEEPLEEESNVSDKIIFMDYKKAEEFGLGNNSNFNNVNWNNLGRKLQEFYSHRFGFYIIEIPFRELDYLINEIKMATQNLRPYIIIISPKLEGKEDYEFTKESKVIIKDLVKIKRKICSLIFGSVIPKEDDRWIAGKTFDNLFTSCYKEYITRLIKLEQQKIRVENEEVSVPLLVKRVDKECDLHYKIKIFIVKYLYEKEQCKKNSVKIEEKLKASNITPDVHVGNTAYEVETLYGSAKPLNKIVEKVRNYKDLPIKVKIVLKNWDVFIYFKHLIDLEKELREKENFDVEFMTLNLEENTLINIKELGQSFHSIFYNPKYKFLF